MTRVRVKICGLTRAEDVDAALAAGVDALGFNFIAQSPRCLDPVRAAALIRRVPESVDTVGLFLGGARDEVLGLARDLGLRALQWYGEEGPPWLDPAPWPLWAPYRVGSRQDLAAIDADLARRRQANRAPAAVLVDARVEGQLGGTGVAAPWEMLADWKPGAPLILAGGLTIENLAQAIRIVRPWGVDVASGVERAPGVKDADLLERFVAAARHALP